MFTATKGRRPGAGGVDGLGEEPLAGARLAEDQHRRAGPGGAPALS